MRLPLAQFRQLSADAAFLDKDIENAGRPAQLYRFGTFELEPTLAVSKMTAAQFIDFSTMTKDMQPEDLDGRLVGILSCFLVPKGKGYCEGYDVADVQAAIRDNMSVYDAAALIAFFLTSSARYVKDSLRFSEKMTKGIKDRKTRKEMQKKIAEAADFMDQKMNAAGETITDQCRYIAHDYEIFGGFALMVRRNVNGGVAAVDYIDMRYLRLNKTGDVFYYSEKWAEPGRKNVLVYPAFMAGLDWASLDETARNKHMASILYVKRGHTQVYPLPIYGAAVKACEIERCIDDYHLNSIENGFTSSLIINFNNGVPDDEQKEQIEEDVNEKFSGHQNAGRIMCSFNPDKESAATFEVPDIKDFGERYNALAKHSRQQIFTSFRAIPALFGLMNESTGFSSQEFAESFKLYNRTQIRPVQRLIADAYDKIFGVQGILTITPFDISNIYETKVN